MGGHHHRRHFSQRRCNCDPGARREPKPIARNKSIAFAGNEPIAFAGNESFAFAGNKPESLARHFPQPKPSAKLQPNRHRQHDDRGRRRFL